MYKKSLIILILLLSGILRLWHLDQEPVALFGDEIDVGYQAYSLLKTGKDYLGNLVPLHLESLADKKAPLYSYSMIPSIAIFGISPFGVRLPAAIFGVLNVFLLYLLAGFIFKKWQISILAAFLLAVSPWHIQYSRFGFEGTEMLALYLGGLYFFFKGLQRSSWFILSAFLFGLSIWAYHSAKVFLPITLFSLVAIWWKTLINFSKKQLLVPLIVLMLVTAPIVWDTIFSGGAERFGSTSVFSDPTGIPTIGFDRLRDAKMSDSEATLASTAIPDKIIHSLPALWMGKISDNYLKAFGTEFLFIRGDPNLRHSVLNQGEFYKFEALFLILGIIFFFTKPIDKKMKMLIIFWLLASPLPSIITGDGGSHASRLFFMLPPLVFLVALGLYYTYETLGRNFRKLFILGVAIVFILSFWFYQHNLWIHYPWDSERWWQAGYSEAIKSTVVKGKNYEKIIISNADEPSLIFFLGWSEYSPEKFQKNYPLPKENLPGFGVVSKLDKYYFPVQGFGVNLYDLGNILPENTLYLATAKEINVNLITEPERVPKNIILIKSFAYPSGAPAFYLLSKAN